MPPIAQTINVPAPPTTSSSSSSSPSAPTTAVTAAASAGTTPLLASTPPPSSQLSQSPPLVNSTPKENCPKCDKPISGPYVRALGGVFHAPCFTCLDCGTVVVQKFFSFELLDGRQVPLCETDYFKRLDLLCAKCGQALRAGYITSSDKKYHPDHFTCSICPTVFGQNDSYYEHNDQVYCHFHYSTRCAARCASCHSAILKQYVEINRNSRDETYHPECYMISKFWNVKLAPARPSSAPPLHEEEEKRFTPTALREFQRKMDGMVHRIWTVLSAFEESSAACISDMLRFVSDGSYLDAVRSAERFIFHVEVLLAALDDIHHLYVSRDAVRAFSYARESRMLCRKTVDLFTSLSNAQKETSRQGMTQELLALITGIAHFLKILIRIALLGALKLQREYPEPEGVSRFLDPLQRMAEENGDPTARRLVDSPRPPSSYTSKPSSEVSIQISISVSTHEPRQSPSTKGVIFGFKSLAPELAGVSPCIQEYNDARDGTAEAAKYTPPSDLCLKCQETIEDDCVRLGTFLRWHAWCLTCVECGRAAGSRPTVREKAMMGNGNGDGEDGDDGSHDGHEHRHTPTPGASATPSTPLAQPSLAEHYVYHPEGGVGSPQANGLLLAIGKPPSAIYCPDHRMPDAEKGFHSVTRLEQYAFLLTVALRRLYFILKRRGAIVPPTGPLARLSPSPTNRESMDMMRMKSLNLDRKTSLTARTPRRSTILQGPTGKVAQATDNNQQSTHQHSNSTSNANSTAARRPSRALPPPANFSGGNSPTPINSSASLVSTEGTTAVASDASDNSTVRPAFARHNTEVIIVEDEQRPPRREPSEDTTQLTDEPEAYSDRDRAGGGGGGQHQSRESEVLMLHDISSLVKAEHAKERRLSSVSAGKGKTTDVPALVPLLTDLEAYDTAIVKHAAVWLLYHSELRDKFDLDEVLELIEIRKAGIWNKIFKAEKKGKKKGVFGVPLSELVDREGVDSTLGIGHGPVRIPSFVDDIITALKQMDISVEGIFRKNGNIRRLKEVIEELEKDPGYGDFASDNPVQLAALLKKFFKELPDPLLTFRLHGLFIATQTIASEDERRRLLHLVSVIMPKSHRSTMEVFFAFLKWVSLFSHGTGSDAAGSKMDLPNLSTVIAPSVLYAKGNDALRDQSLTAIRVVTQMLEEQDIFNDVPEQCLPLLEERKEFSKYMNESSKDFLKRIDAVFKGKKYGGPQPGVASPLMAPVNAAPFQASNFKLDQGPDIRGRQLTPPERPGSRPSQSLERSGEKKEKERNTLRKPKPVHPGLPHSPYSMPPLANGSGATISGSSSRPVSPPPGAPFAVSTNGTPAVRALPAVWKPTTPLPLSPPELGNSPTPSPRP